MYTHSNNHVLETKHWFKSGTVSDVMQFVHWELLGEFQSWKQAVNQWDVGNNGTKVLHYLTSWNPPLPLRICVWLDNLLLFQLPAPIVKSITGWWGVCVSVCVCVCVCVYKTLSGTSSCTACPQPDRTCIWNFPETEDSIYYIYLHNRGLMYYLAYVRWSSPCQVCQLLYIHK